MLTLPTILTLARVVAIPVLIAGKQSHGKDRPQVQTLDHFVTCRLDSAVWFGKDDVAATWTGAIFLVACITDFFDGFLARKMVCLSPFVLSTLEVCIE